jgi:hypothetical protein
MGTNPSHFSRSGDGKHKVKNIADAERKDFPVPGGKQNLACTDSGSIPVAYYSRHVVGEVRI